MSALAMMSDVALSTVYPLQSRIAKITSTAFFQLPDALGINSFARFSARASCLATAGTRFNKKSNI